MTNRIFLGGTCNGSKWRTKLIPLLNMRYFNPVVDSWDIKAQQVEEKEKDECSLLLFCLTPLSVATGGSGFYSIAEVIDAVNKHSRKCLFVVIAEDKREYNDSRSWTPEQSHSLNAVANMVENKGGTCRVINSVREMSRIAYTLNNMPGAK